MGATNNLIGAQFITGIAKLNYPDWELTRWETTLVSYAIALTTLASNVFVPQLLHKVRHRQRGSEMDGADASH